MSSKVKVWLVPVFLGLVALQALLVILDRTGIDLPVPAKLLSGIRLAVALQTLAILALWWFQGWKSHPEPDEPAVP